MAYTFVTVVSECCLVTGTCLLVLLLLLLGITRPIGLLAWAVVGVGVDSAELLAVPAVFDFILFDCKLSFGIVVVVVDCFVVVVARVWDLFVELEAVSWLVAVVVVTGSENIVVVLVDFITGELCNDDDPDDDDDDDVRFSTLLLVEPDFESRLLATEDDVLSCFVAIFNDSGSFSRDFRSLS